MDRWEKLKIQISFSCLYGKGLNTIKTDPYTKVQMDETDITKVEYRFTKREEQEDRSTRRKEQVGSFTRSEEEE